MPITKSYRYCDAIAGVFSNGSMICYFPPRQAQALRLCQKPDSQGTILRYNVIRGTGAVVAADGTECRIRYSHVCPFLRWVLSGEHLWALYSFLNDVAAVYLGVFIR